MTDKMLKIEHVTKMAGVSRPTIYKLIAQGMFPRQVQISVRSVRWRQSQVQEWIKLGQDEWKAQQQQPGVVAQS